MIFTIILLGLASQSASAPSQSSATLSTIPICLTRVVTDAEGVGHPFPFVVRSGELDAAALVKFSAIACQATKIDPARYRAIVCQIAAAPNDAVQERYAAVFGIRARLLCDAATKLGPLLDAAVGAAK